MCGRIVARRGTGLALLGMLCFAHAVPEAAAQLTFGPAESVQAGGTDLVVTGYSVPSFVLWDGDGLRDLVVGEGGGTSAQGKVRVYLNVGTASEPAFASYFYAQSLGSDLVVPAGGCLGVFPRVVYWDADGRKDLLVGTYDGKVKIFSNVGTDADPTFDGGTFVQVGSPGFKTDINVGARATPSAVDWNSDGKKDLVVGALDGKLHVFVNAGTDGAPDFRAQQLAQDGGADLVVPTGRSSAEVLDLDGDGAKDVLTGNTEGQLLLYRNTGSNEAPHFSGYASVESDGAPIDLPASARSRPFLCEWTGDGVPDVLIGSGDGLVRLYYGVDGSVGVDSGRPLASAPRLLSVYPNPFRFGATIPFVLNESGQVHLSVYDAAGRRVARLADEVRDPGTHRVTWSARDDDGRPVPAGTYFVRLEAGGTEAAGKVVVVR
ncbi:MAG: FG-GAP-like repeat-containing protein [bacterium]